MTKLDARSEYNALAERLFKCKSGSPEYKVARLDLIHFERELVANESSVLADEIFGDLCDRADALGTSSVFDDTEEINEFRKEYIDWFRANRFTEVADELEQHLY